jgi:protein-S-isoprenylcysteine O-methyltransferase Ste14
MYNIKNLTIMKFNPTLNSFIGFAKLATTVFIGALMYIYQAFTVISFIYLAMYFSYAICWLLKSIVFPNKNFVKTMNLQDIVLAVPIMFGVYWLIPYLAITNVEPSGLEIVFLSLVLFIVGLVIMMVADAQTYFMLATRPNELVTTGMNEYIRHPNYLGEALLYCSFAILSRRLLSFVLLAMVFAFIFIPLNLAKEESLSRYIEFEHWKKRTGMYLPNVYSFLKVEGLIEETHNSKKDFDEETKTEEVIDLNKKED